MVEVVLCFRGEEKNGNVFWEIVVYSISKILEETDFLSNFVEIENNHLSKVLFTITLSLHQSIRSILKTCKKYPS